MLSWCSRVTVVLFLSVFLWIPAAIGQDQQPAEKEEIVFSLSDEVTLEMVRIPAGSYLRGRSPEEQDSLDQEDPQHLVDIGYDFYMGKSVVTKAQWQAVMGTTPWAGRLYDLDRPDTPAVWITWNDTQAFLTVLNTQQAEGTFRLPSEAEWEYAARAGTTTRFYWGDDPDYTQIDAYAWWRENTWDQDRRYAHPVGQKSPNAFGLYDMSGNVWEWCQDYWYHTDYVGAPTDGSAWESPVGPYRVLRGGSWLNMGHSCRSAFRGGHHPEGTIRRYSGFRLVWVP